MEMTRRELLAAGVGVAGAAMAAGCATDRGGMRFSAPRIDRKAVVSRHNVRVRAMDPYAAITLGNGRFAFTGDVTGLQTFNEVYQKDFPLCTMATWAWHTTPHGAEIDPAKYRYKEYMSHGRMVSYDTDVKGQPAVANWMRENPHRMHLGRIGLVLKKGDGTDATPDDVTGIDQVLDLWTGCAESRFMVWGESVRVLTCVHPLSDALAVRIESGLIRAQRLAVRIAFPYPTPGTDMADWKSPEKHESVCNVAKGRAEIARRADADRYAVGVNWRDAAFKQVAAHEFVLSSGTDSMEFVVGFQSDGPVPEMTSFEETRTASAAHWAEFWESGGAIDLSGSTDPRAEELERRVVLSAYNTALHCAGDMPPQETGLLFDSVWFGKSHLEMHWWHGVHFAAWGRMKMFERSMEFYQRIMPVAKAIAVRQGYEGVRWPKMVGPDGLDSPSPVGPLLIWQQPHPIYYAELSYQRNPTAKTLAKWREIVFATADFMASYAALDGDRYVLGPPLKTVSENTDQLRTINPTFELTYWRFGLSTAQMWRKRLGMAEDPKWADVLSRLSPLPVDQGRYLFQEGTTDTYTKWSYEHPAILGAYGMQPGGGVDPEIMRNSLKEIMRVWQWDRAWGWDFPMAAMAAAKLGERDVAFEALLIESPKNHYHPNGHVYQRPGLTAYLPANGGLMGAMAMLAVGSGPDARAADGRVVRNGKWGMRAEGIRPLL